MKGKIFRINHARRMVAVLTTNNDFSIFENTSGMEFYIDDEVSWENSTGLGRQSICNVTQNGIVNVFFENHWVSKAILKKQLLEE